MAVKSWRNMRLEKRFLKWHIWISLYPWKEVSLAQLLKMLPLFNEIEKILDNVNPDDLLEPEVKSTKKRQEEKAKIKREWLFRFGNKRNNSSFNKRQIMSRMWFFDERVKVNDFVWVKIQTILSYWRQRWHIINMFWEHHYIDKNRI